MGLTSYFKIKERGSTWCTELRAGTATFMTLCYILAVNARLLAESGGPCDSSDGGPFTAAYEECLESFRRQLITITATSSCIACIMMGLFANLPFALAPGMGLNAYFTYDVVGFRGGGSVAWKTAITAVFIEGIIFMLLAITGLRVKFAKLIPEPVKIATTGGIGLFLAHLGLQSAEGFGLVVTDIATGLTLGGCPAETRSYASYDCKGTFEAWQAGGSSTAFPPFFLTSDSYTCDAQDTDAEGVGEGKMQSHTLWLGIATLMLTSVLLKRGWRGAIIIGVILASFISWWHNPEWQKAGLPDMFSTVSYFSDTVYPIGGSNEYMGPSGGEYRYEYFKQYFKLEPIKDTWFQFDFSAIEKGEFPSKLIVALFTFLYVDLLDTTATLFAMAKFAGMLDENGDFEGQTVAFMVDGAATSFGACMGTSPVTTYIESAPGIEEGGRTGVTAIVVGIYFGISVFFAPLLASIPPWATGPALVVVGAMMMRGLKNINWEDYGEAIPAFLTICIMPLTYSIAYGIIAGISSYIIIQVLGYQPCKSKKSEPTVDLEQIFVDDKKNKA